MIPTIAVVGKPNTGKSTLFNRMLGHKSAITFDESGTTRDRVFGHMYLDEKPILLVDTGGLDLMQESNELEVNIQKQTHLAIAEADLIIFLVDGTEELTVTDFNAAQFLRESHKPVILVASKCDNLKSDDFIFNLYELGFGDPIKLSSIHNIGLDELEDAILKSLKKQNITLDEKEVHSDLITLSFVGRPNVGKSSIVNSLLGKDQVIVTPIAGTTRDAISLHFDYNDQKFVFVDTAGIRRMGKLRGQWLDKFSFVRSLQSIEISDIAVLVIDAAEGVSKQDLRVSEYILEAHKGLIIVLNKCDLIDAEAKDRLIDDLKYKMDYVGFAPVVFVSALTGKNILEILNCSLLIAQERKKRIPDMQLNYLLEVLVGKHSPGAGILITYAEQVSIEPPTFVFTVNKPQSIHFSYKRYLENEIRKKFGFNGTAVRLIFKDRQHTKKGL
jgi:GTP-binding protein